MPELFTSSTGRLVFPSPAPMSPTRIERSAGRHGRASAGYGLGEGSTNAGAGRSTHDTISGTGDDVGVVCVLEAAEGDVVRLAVGLADGELATQPAARPTVATSVISRPLARVSRPKVKPTMTPA